jgi:L-fucose isomerase-like protein
MKRKTKLGVIVGNRGFFPDHLCESGRETILEVLEAQGIDAIALPVDATTFGAVESISDAGKCAQLFKQHRDEIDGVLVTLPNFGDERAVANSLRMSELSVPVLVHAFGDDAENMTIKDRRDSFCGKMSVCNNLRQYGIKYSLTSLHTSDPRSESFTQDLKNFTAICRIVKGLKRARVGMIGARPAAFNTVRFSEKLLESQGISVETLDLSEMIGRVERLQDDDASVQDKLNSIKEYTTIRNVPDAAMLKMAKLGAIIDKWMDENELVASAVQCWTAMQDFYGVVPCTLMSMMSNRLMPSACETDIAGLVGMLALQLASGTPSAILDWNNNYGTEQDKGVLFHCSNLPKAFFTKHRMDYQEIIAGSLGKDNTYGTIVGRIAPGPFTYCRVSTDDCRGRIAVYCGEGRFTDDPLDTFGGFGVVEIPEMQKLLTYICENGFEHHVAANVSQVGDAVAQALGKYMGWDVYKHGVQQD